MPKGKVKWFNPTKGYGFITPEEGDKDVFVHITAVRDSGMENLDEDQEVEYELVEKVLLAIFTIVTLFLFKE